jgi:hypothetical protein
MEMTNIEQRQLRMTIALLVVCFTLLPAAAHLQGQTASDTLQSSSSEVLSLDTIVENMTRARAENRNRFRPFVVTRNYRMFGQDQTKPRSEVTVTISFTPPARKTFVILQSSGGIGERTVRRILQSESESAKNYSATDYSVANYTFRLLAADQLMSGARCLLLEMTPKRNERILLRGKIWVDAETFRVHRLEGVPAKSSSWWIKDETIVLHYGEVEGMWLQTGTEGTAKVRVLGPHRLIATDVKYEVGPQPLSALPDGSMVQAAE